MDYEELITAAGEADFHENELEGNDSFFGRADGEDGLADDDSLDPDYDSYDDYDE